jgi:hypothetical protein
MILSQRWRSGTAMAIALGLTSAVASPLMMASSVAASEPSLYAQIFSQNSTVGLGEGTVIPVRYDEGEKIVVLPDETAPVTLTVAQDIRTNRGTVIIPAGTLIEGELRPDDDGTRFYAENLVYTNNDNRYSIDATSNVITERETITKDTDPDILRGAVIGAAAGAVLGEIFGSIDFLEVLGGAGVGALASILIGGDREEVEVLVVNPETDLDLTLQDAFVLR